MPDDETNERYTLLWSDSRYENVPLIYHYSTNYWHKILISIVDVFHEIIDPRLNLK